VTPCLTGNSLLEIITHTHTHTQSVISCLSANDTTILTEKYLALLKCVACQNSIFQFTTVFNLN